MSHVYNFTFAPQQTTTPTKVPSPNFVFLEPDKNDQVDQSWTIERICREAIPSGWYDVFAASQNEFRFISQKKDSTAYFPLKKDLFNAFRKTPLNEVKVVIIGQDPYYQVSNINGIAQPTAKGMSFSVDKDDVIPASLKNIYKELHRSTNGNFQIPDHGDLSEWAKQGVLLLNTCLTVAPNLPNSHQGIWDGFIDKVLRAIAAVNPKCIFLLWGGDAKKLQDRIGNQSVILTAPHPVARGAHNTPASFIGCNHFNLVNAELTKQGKTGINWQISPKHLLNNTGINMVPQVPVYRETVNNNRYSTLPDVNLNSFPKQLLTNSQHLPTSMLTLPEVPNIQRPTVVDISITPSAMTSSIATVKPHENP